MFCHINDISYNDYLISILYVGSLLYDADAGMNKFLEDVYEHESRNIPGGYWGQSNVPFTNVVKS